MSRYFRTVRRAILGLMMAFTAFLPLWAQLDPNLQTSKTDFMDLYQQSTSLKAKPEIVTVFDYSRSMASLMYHPLYRNNDVADNDDSTRYMKFVLIQSGSSTSAVVHAANSYTIRATPYCKGAQSSGASVTYDVTWNGSSWVGTNGAAPVQGCPATTGAFHPAINNDTAITLKAAAAGNTAAFASVTFTPSAGADPTFTLSSNANVAKTGYTLTHANGSVTPAPTIELSATSGGKGSTITMTVYLTHPFLEGENPNNKNITWSASGGLTSTGNPSAVGTFNNGSATWTEVSSGLYKSVITWTIPGFTPTAAYTDPNDPGDPVLLRPITVSPSQPFTSLTSLTFNTYFATMGSSTYANYNKIVWTVTKNAGNACPGVTLATAPTSTLATTFSGPNVTWTVPAACSNDTGGVVTTTDPYVTVTLDPRYNVYPGSTPVPGITYLGSQLTGDTKATSTIKVLIKPNGQPVTKDDANLASSLYGSVLGQEDVRNWIRAASHVRFKSGTRTIDIPIPWKITDVNSTGNPLSSVAVLDQKIVSSIDSVGNPITTTYGSGTNIEMDLAYKVEGITAPFAGAVFTENTNLPGTQCKDSTTKATAETTVYLYSVLYRPAYVSWLFNGKYQNTDPSAPGYVNSLSSIIGKYIVFDAGDTTLAAGQGNVSWGQGYGPTGLWGNIEVPSYNSDGTFKNTGLDEASTYRIPALTRLQATKQAAIRTWIKHQDEVLWAFRFLDPTNEATPVTKTTIDNNSAATLTAGDPTTTHMNGNDSAWTVLNNTSAQTIIATNGNSVTGMKRIASMFAWGSTPLTYAMARSLAQFSDPNSVFNAIVGTDVSQCVNHYLLLFTDGVDNNNDEGHNNANTQTPYIIGDGTTGNPFRLSALNGNQKTIAIATLNDLDRTGPNWNLFNFAGVAAHLSDSTLGVLNTDYMPAPDPGTTASSAKVPSAFLPFAIKKRNGIYYDKDHRITTMTVGVSLGGQYTDTTSPKRSLFLAAAVGDPTVKIGDLSTFHTFVGWIPTLLHPNSVDNDWIADPQDPTSYPTGGKRKDGAVFFFDATDPDKLTNSMDFAFKIAIGAGGNNSTSSPNLPFVGASLGKQVYLGSFNPPKVGGAIWPGDLMMFGTREEKGTISIIDKSGNITSTVDKSTAQWSAEAALLARPWNTRTLYTRWPGDNIATLRKFTTSGKDYDDGSGGGLQKYVATSVTAPITADARKAVVQFAMGGDTNLVTAPTPPTTNRLSIMGDIINSAPAAIEYNFEDVKDYLTARLAAVGGDRFRLILVGTNQGWLHAFGEVTKTTKVTGNDLVVRSIVTGDVDELWSFMPTDFLANLNYIKDSGNKHRFMVDGTPAIYHLDMPPVSGGSGNGIVDKTERAIAILGLRKGGRSYYALDIHLPFSPAMQWSLVPDEADGFPTDSIVSGQKRIVDGDGGPTLAAFVPVLKKSGFSTSTPAFGRVLFSGVVKDAVFLGGGFSVPEVENNYLDKTAKPTPMGRSVMALDVYTGAVLAMADLTDATIAPHDGSDRPIVVGPVGAGIIPFEFFLNSGMAQRAYFLDYKGGLWSWGSRDTATTGSYKNFRMDTSELTSWKVRKVYQDDNNATSGRGGRYSTLPAPFKVGYFPGVGQAGTASPAAVGIAMVSGDRNNPLDFRYGEKDAYGNTNLAPVNHRLTVVFDRQDSRAWGFDSDTGPDTGITDKYLLKAGLADPTGPSTLAAGDTRISPGTSGYYLAPTTGTPAVPDTSSTLFGYYINFPSMTNKFLAKGINPPIVVAGSLFYSEFIPASADPCTGGSGKTWSWFLADVQNPIVSDARTGLTTKSGLTNADNPWSGVASDYIPVGTRAVIQGGTVSVNNPQPGAALTTPELHTTQGLPSQKYPKPRVWRTVH